ncbi:hypothetical protein LX64_01139 [Chitinophaga skermanii]|uniref:HEAT repeat protein n=1 Tax=Chitinophaga skermanii TaxID=331697 RepID=A0A327R3N1_9BACT|nr:HEAT repeat domain-containing protein [Chitinophaga skermanii]RAJ08487.1 hypothetical protein LX64_01139 [Chitinophaga skermanii]
MKLGYTILPYSWQTQSFYDLPVFIQGAIVVSLLAIGATVLVFLRILMIRVIRFYYRRRGQRLRSQIDMLIMEHIISSEPVRDIATIVFLPTAAFQHLPLHKRWARRILVHRLQKYRSNFSGSVSESLRQLYIALGLQKDAARDLHALSWSKKVGALGELFNMEIGGYESQALHLTQHRNRYVRGMARCYIVKISEDHPFSFLDHINAPLVSWEQFELFKIITDRQGLAIPAFAKWMNEQYHPSVVSFSLKLAVHFMQFDAIPRMIALLDSPLVAIRAEAVNSLGKLMAQEAEDILVMRYSYEELPVQIEILKAIGRIGTGRYLPFLEYIFHTSANDFLLRKHSAKSIERHRFTAGIEIEKLLNTSAGDEHLHLQHALNPLIKY